MHLPTVPANAGCVSLLARALLLALPVLAAVPAQTLAQGYTDTVALLGQSAPGAGTFSGLGTAVLNDAGQTAFFATITGGTNTGGIYRGSGSTLTAIALQGQSAPGVGAGTFLGISNPVLNDSGQTAFRSQITGGTISDGIFRSNGSTLTAIVLQGQSAPGAGAGTFSSFFSPALNGAGQTAFLSLIIGGGSSEGIYRSSNGGALTAIALQGQSAPGAGAGTFAILNAPELNDAGQTAFLATITGGTNTQGIYRSSSGSTLTAIALQGESAPGAGAGTFSFLGSPVLNNTGQTAFRSFLDGGTSTQGIFRSSGGSTLMAIALQGQSAPGAGAGTFLDLTEPLLNDTGLTAFHASIAGGTSSRGLYLGDGRDTMAAQLQGNTLAGKTVGSFLFSPAALNRHGQLAYRANFTDGSRGIFVFTPALRWRETFSSSWDEADHWTLGIAPASVHDVSIDPTVALTVTGPAGSVNVRSLTVGGGTGFATLSLAGGTLTSASAVQIAGRGILTGSGSIATQVVNAGEVRADSLILGGGLINNGTVRGMATGNQRIDTDLTNNAGGVVRAGAGEVLKLVGTSHTNNGLIEARSGAEMQITGALGNTGQMVVEGSVVRMSGAATNSGTGRISLNQGTLYFNGGLSNSGQMQVSFGGGEVFGNVTTNAGGKIILSGNSQTTFYDAVDVKSGGELRVSGGSASVFFGQVFQRTGALFTGTGTKFYEGGLSIGGSPGLGVDGGNVGFGAGNLYLAEIGGTALGDAAGNGLEFDRLLVAGELALGGTLKMVSWNSFVAQAGQRFDLFDWGTLKGTFDAIDSSGFTLAAGTALDYSDLYADGSIRVAAVPEPETYALLLAGLGLVGFAARRKVRCSPAGRRIRVA